MDESGNHKQAEQRERIRWIVSILIPLLCALLSFCVIAKYTSSPTMKINAHAIQSLDDKKTTALELTAAATAASAAITLIPGDAGTPIADKLADLSSYFLIVVCAIYLEKYLVTITGLAAFKLLIPIGCILLSLCFGFKKDLGRTIACKLVLFGLAVYLVVPVSVRVADLIDATYGASMENTIASAKQATDEIKGEADTQSQESSGSDTGGKSSFWSGLVDKVEDTVTGAKVNLENTLNRFIEAIAVMLVTSCVIPILVLLFFVWLVKLVLGVNITLPQIGKKKKEELAVKPYEIYIEQKEEHIKYCFSYWSQDDPLEDYLKMAFEILETLLQGYWLFICRVECDAEKQKKALEYMQRFANIEYIYDAYIIVERANTFHSHLLASYFQKEKEHGVEHDFRSFTIDGFQNDMEMKKTSFRFYCQS